MSTNLYIILTTLTTQFIQSTVLQAKSSRRIMDPLHYDEKLAQSLSSGVTTSQTQAAFAWRKVSES